VHPVGSYCKDISRWSVDKTLNLLYYSYWPVVYYVACERYVATIKLKHSTR